MIGRISIIKSLALSKLLYNASVLFVPEHVVKEVNREIFKCLWNYKREKIKQNTLIGNYNEGGLNMLDFQTQIFALKVKWVNRLLTETDHAWSHLAMSFLEKVCVDVRLIFHSNVTNSQFLPRCESIPKLYIQMLDMLILENKKVIFFSNWVTSDILYVKDICTVRDFISTEMLVQKLTNSSN